jgi:hypothetical protein
VPFDFQSIIVLLTKYQPALITVAGIFSADTQQIINIINIFAILSDFQGNNVIKENYLLHVYAAHEVLVNATYLSLSTSLTFLLARHCLTIINNVPALDGESQDEKRSALGCRRTRHK